MGNNKLSQFTLTSTDGQPVRFDRLAKLHDVETANF